MSSINNRPSMGCHQWAIIAVLGPWTMVHGSIEDHVSLPIAHGQQPWTTRPRARSCGARGCCPWTMDHGPWIEDHVSLSMVHGQQTWTMRPRGFGPAASGLGARVSGPCTMDTMLHGHHGPLGMDQPWTMVHGSCTKCLGLAATSKS